MRVLWLMVPFLLFGGEHTAVVEPIEVYHVKAAAGGAVVESRSELEGTELKDAVVVRIDDRLDRAQLKATRKKLAILERNLEAERASAKALRRLADLRRKMYERIKDLRTKSQVEKERRLAEYLSAQNLYLAQRAKLASLEMQREDLRLAITRLEDTIAKKNAKLSGYLFRLYPRRGDYLAPGAPLADVADTSRAKVVVYLSRKEAERIESKKITAGGRPAKLLRLIRIPDERHLGQYRAEIEVERPKIFGKLIKVEIR